jgi:hypothetical protein
MTGRGVKIGAYPIPALSANYQVSRNTIAEDSFGIATQGTINAGSYTTSGTIAAAYRPAALAAINNMVMGGTNTINTTGAYTYTTVDMEDDYSHVTSFASCVINSLELALATEDYARITYNFTGTKKATAPGTIAAASYTEELAIFYNAKLTIDSGGGATTVYAKSLTLRIERPLTPDYIIGSEYALNLNQSGNLTVGGTLGLAASEYSLLLNALTTADEAKSQPNETNENSLGGGELIIELRRPDGTAYQTITVTSIKVNTGSQSGEGRQVMTKSVDFLAEVNASSNVTFSAVS